MAGEITVTDLQNAKLDTDTIAEVSNVGTVLDTTTNRDGVVIDTLLGRLKKLGFLPPVAYAGSISFLITDNFKTIARNGIVYNPDPNALPFTTSGTWAADDEDKFFVTQVGSTATLPADQITIADAGGLYVSTDAEDALQEVPTVIENELFKVGNKGILDAVKFDKDNPTGLWWQDSSNVTDSTLLWTPSSHIMRWLIKNIAGSNTIDMQFDGENETIVLIASGGVSLDSLASSSYIKPATYVNLAAINAAISTPSTGMIVDTTTQGLARYNGTNWVQVSDNSTLIT